MADISSFSRMADELPDQDYSPVPEGWYTADIAKAELKETKDGTGQYINCQYKITGPTQAGRVVFGMVNLKNKNPQAEEIGLRQLKQLRAACGLATLRNTDELQGRTIKIKVKIQPASGEYEARNTVADYASAGAAPQITQDAPKSATTSAPPWARS